MGEINWKDEIAKLMFIKTEMKKKDKEGLWDYHLPNVGATEEEIKSAERIIGYEFNPIHKDFLKCANGWNSFYQTVSLFGTNDYQPDSKILERSNLFLDIEEDEGILEMSGLKRSEIVPIAVTLEDLDLFVITNHKSKKHGEVIWFAGGEIERFENFHQFYLSMLDYVRLCFERL